MNVRLILGFLLLGWLSNCQQVPREKLSQWEQDIDVAVANDTLTIGTTNPLGCPVRVIASSPVPGVREALAATFPVTLPASGDTVLKFRTDKTKEELQIKLEVTMGDPTDTVRPGALRLPFPPGRAYRVIQGYGGGFSHTSDYSRYALDFDLQRGDTVCAAAHGVVVGVIEGYKAGGNTRKWRDYANFITLFHPGMNLYTQYVHLMHAGSFVAVGDTVAAGQPIGRSGKTGYTSTEHLHFNVLVATAAGVASLPVEFREGLPGSALRKGSLAKH